jgi:hypothetical protein
MIMRRGERINNPKEEIAISNPRLMNGMFSGRRGIPVICFE